MTTQTNNQTTKSCCTPECCQPEAPTTEALKIEAPVAQTPLTQDEIRSTVREHYGKLALSNSSCCGPVGCNSATPEISLALGYSTEELAAVPEGANLGLGCGNPQAIAALQPGEVVLDLGSGAGFDCFLAARQVGVNGKVIGVDMTPAMLSKARENAQKLKANNVEFRLGEIEHLPVADQSVNAIISNCVINLSPDKAAVFREAFRVLAPGGRLAISDVVLLQALPPQFQTQLDALTGCVSGAAPVMSITQMLKEVGFSEVKISVKQESRDFIQEWMPNTQLEDYISSATIEAIKPSRSTP
jgi:arsenite methyltransferase